MGLYLRQLLAGRDFATSDPIAGQMANFVYVIGDQQSRECVVVDPAWDISGILEQLDLEDLKLVGALVTHYHPDHIGGAAFGHSIQGLADLQRLRPVKAYVNAEEAQGVKLLTGLSDSDLVAVSGGDTIQVGNLELTFLHTPGHTPGSHCFLIENSLISGDTLFIGGCGRVDLPGGDSDQLYYSLTQVLARLPDSTAVYPGHNYAAQQVSSIGDEKRGNLYMRVPTLEAWRNMMG